MNLLFATGSAATYMAPPVLSDQQVNCGPDWINDVGRDGRVRSFATPCGEYDLFSLAEKLPSEQRPDVVVCLVDSSWRNLPRNLEKFNCPRVLLMADTHHLESPILGMLRYLAGEAFDRIVLLYDRHHAGFFRSAGFHNLYWFPGLTFPHTDETVRRARSRSERAQRIAFVGQAGRFHPRRQRLLRGLESSNLPLEKKALHQRDAMAFYGSSLLGFNASLNGDLNLRVFEILSAGGALLTDRLSQESGFSQILTGRETLEPYDSAEELIERATYALAHSGETQEIGAHGAKWFDRNFSEFRRRVAFKNLALNGVALPGFELSSQPIPTVFFSGELDRMLDTTVVYEAMQAKHSEQEIVTVVLCDGIPADIRAILSTLPRIIFNAAVGVEIDLAVFCLDRLLSFETRAHYMWCCDATTGDMQLLTQRMSLLGYISASDTVALYVRVPAKALVGSQTRQVGLLVLAQAALRSSDFALCRETLTIAVQLGCDEAQIAKLLAELNEATKNDDSTLRTRQTTATV